MVKVITRNLVLLLSLIGVFTSLPSNAADNATPLAWTPANAPQVSTQEIQVLFGDQVYIPSSNLNWSMDMNPTELGSKLPFLTPWIYYALPKCSEKFFDGCIELIQYRFKGGEWSDAHLSSRELTNRIGETNPAGRNSEGVISTSTIVEKGPDMANHKPSSGRASYWIFKNAPHGGGNEYLVRANIAGMLVADKTGRVQRYLEMGIYPVQGLTEYQFPKDIEIRVRLKLGILAKDLWGWFDGRVLSPEVLLDTASDKGIVEITGEPARIPLGATPKRLVSEFKPDQLTEYTCDGRTTNICNSLSGSITYSTSGNNKVENFPRFENLLGRVSTIGTSTAWWIKTTRWSNVATVTGCKSDQKGFTGIITTNATMYKTEAPIWNSQDQTFDFQVASPHFDEKGEPNQGYYSLVLPRALAECRWGSEIANAKAVVSIVSENGTSQVATSTFKVANELLFFNISGFNYSSPKIKIGLVAQPRQATLPSASPTPSPLISSTPATKSIKCVKGKQVKTITSRNPKCPAGYKLRK